MASIDPYLGTLGSRLAKHLLRRATFNITKARIAQYANYTVDEAISQFQHKWEIGRSEAAPELSLVTEGVQKKYEVHLVPGHE